MGYGLLMPGHRFIGTLPVHQLKGSSGDALPCRGVGGQARKHAGAPFGGLVEEQGVALLGAGQRLGHQLALFKLEVELYASLDGVLEGSRGGGRHFQLGAYYQGVAAVGHVGRDTLALVDGLIGIVVVGFLLFVLDPVAVDGVDHEAIDGGVFAPLPAQVDAPQVSLLGILHLGEQVIALAHLATDYLELAIFLRVLERGAQIVALSHALLFVAGDPRDGTGGDVLNAKEVMYLLGFGQRRAAGHAEVEVKLLVEVPVVAVGTDPDPLFGQPGFIHLLLLHGTEDHPLDAVLLALVIDQAERAEFRDSQEARPREHTAVALPAPLAGAGDEGGQRQAREVVAGEEALAGEVAVGLEVRLTPAVVLEQAQLDGAFVEAALGDLALLPAAARVHHQLGGFVDLAEGGGVKLAPATEAVVEGAHGDR